MNKTKRHGNTRGKIQAFLKTFQSNGALFICLLFFCVGTISLILNIIRTNNICLSVTIVSISVLSALVTLVFKCCEYRKEEKNLYHVDHLEYKIQTLNKISKQYVTPQNGYCLHFIDKTSEAYLHSESVDKTLRNPSTSITLINNKDKYILPIELTPLVPFALKNKLNSNHIFYNGTKVRLMTELTQNTSEVVIQKTDYFSTFCTNDLVYLKIRSRRSLNKRFYGHLLLFNERDELSSLDESILSNNIGVSTLAITSDNYLIVGLQGERNTIGANHYVPTASGSSDYHDSKGQKTLHGLLTFAMEREFREEYNLPSSAKIDTKIVGYLRLLKRGGKPDFFGISTINMNKEDIIRCFRKGREFKNGFMNEPVFIKYDDLIVINKKIRALNNLTIQLHYYLNHYFI